MHTFANKSLNLISDEFKLRKLLKYLITFSLLSCQLNNSAIKLMCFVLFSGDNIVYKFSSSLQTLINQIPTFTYTTHI